MQLPRLLTPAAGVVEPPPPARALARRRCVVGATLVVGVALLAATLAVSPRSTTFYLVGFVLAAVYVGGSLLSGPLHLGRTGGAPGTPDAPAAPGRRAVVGPIVLGVVSYLVFLALYLVARDLPLLEGALEGILEKADAAALGWVLALALANAVAEEVFFRGALPEAVGGRWAHPVSVLAYAAVTIASRNLALVAAALVMGIVFTLERLSTRGILAPILTHVTWSTLMLLALPR
jgi:membrane protease YdiL (CAAX protease family)